MTFPIKTALVTGAVLLSFSVGLVQAQSTSSVTGVADDLKTTATEMTTEATGTAIPASAPLDLATAKVADLVGARVFGTEGTSVGKINTVAQMNDKTFAVIGMGGFLGMGRHDVAVELDKLIPLDQASLRLEGYSKDDLKGMPEFDPATATKMEAEAPLMPAS